MNIEQVYIIDELKEKVRLLKQKMEDQKNNYSRLASDYKDLEKQHQDQQKELKDLRNENKTLKLAKAFVNNGDTSHDAKLQINRIVREIDRCIALLNR